MAAAVTLTLEEEEEEEVRDEADAIGAFLVDPPARLAELAVLALAAPPRAPASAARQRALPLKTLTSQRLL